MRQIILSIIISLIFIGCGGGGGGGESQSSSNSQQSINNIPSESFDTSSFSTASYMLPSISSNSVKTRSINRESYSANFRSIDRDTVIETPQNTNGEKIKYEKTNNYIKVTLIKDNQNVYSYNLKNTIHIGESITEPESSCIFVNYFSKKTINNTQYNDVIEINCGKNKAFYAKGEGLVHKE